MSNINRLTIVRHTSYPQAPPFKLYSRVYNCRPDLESAYFTATTMSSTEGAKGVDQSHQSPHPLAAPPLLIIHLGEHPPVVTLQQPLFVVCVNFKRHRSMSRQLFFTVGHGARCQADLQFITQRKTHILYKVQQSRGVGPACPDRSSSVATPTRMCDFTLAQNIVSLKGCDMKGSQRGDMEVREWRSS